MLMEDALDTKKSISQDDAFIVIRSTDTDINSNLNNSRDSSLGVLKKFHSIRNGYGCNTGNFKHTECAENSSQAIIERQPPCKLPVAKQLPNRDRISQVFVPEIQNTYNSASKTINHSNQLPLCYNKGINTLLYL